MTLNDLHNLAQELGLRIQYDDTIPTNGLYHPPTNTIFVKTGLPHAVELCSTAHELGHATLGHIPTTVPWLQDRQERQADEWAAKALISVSEYRAAEAAVGCNVAALAEELGVTRWCVEAWRVWWMRTHPR